MSLTITSEGIGHDDAGNRRERSWLFPSVFPSHSRISANWSGGKLIGLFSRIASFAIYKASRSVILLSSPRAGLGGKLLMTKTSPTHSNRRRRSLHRMRVAL
ncbi:hypothetical protein BDV36DRAFT_216915 [Aspergillus pseudocaelatus]|uniref:Uncharacterized protein n=1 Tax=Aspergillus pseudocaelatus TaxID=1825620 RepID=A0ABQ6WF85_9EURO|nr:hypothetical protein BDV36DRAFT_216915 [Aspergillus pseudocaelatus]